MAMIKKLADKLSSFTQSVASLLKVMLLSRHSTVKPSARCGEEIVVLGNGPSLLDTIANHSSFLAARRSLAVNFAAIADEFFTLKPDYYVLADPLFFKDEATARIERLWEVLRQEVDWQMTLYVPATECGPRLQSLSTNPHLRVEKYNLTPIEGGKSFCRYAFRHGWGMPRPRNVLIPSIMLAIAGGYKKIYVAGADHSWMSTISVDDDNRVVSIQPHYYKDDEGEQKRVNKEYMNYPLHQIVYSFYVAFRSYHIIKDYADGLGVEIYNITPGSFIDAFPRLTPDD